MRAEQVCCCCNCRRFLAAWLISLSKLVSLSQGVFAAPDSSANTTEAEFSTVFVYILAPLCARALGSTPLGPG